MPGCRDTAERFEKLDFKTPNGHYRAAGYRAILARLETGPAAKADADRAMDSLRRAFAAGFNGFIALGLDADFVALRGREDYRELREAMARALSPPAKK